MRSSCTCSTILRRRIELFSCGPGKPDCLGTMQGPKPKGCWCTGHGWSVQHLPQSPATGKMPENNSSLFQPTQTGQKNSREVPKQQGKSCRVALVLCGGGSSTAELVRHYIKVFNNRHSLFESAWHCFLVSSVVVGPLCGKVSKSTAAEGMWEGCPGDAGECLGSAAGMCSPHCCLCLLPWENWA